MRSTVPTNGALLPRKRRSTSKRDARVLSPFLPFDAPTLHRPAGCVRLSLRALTTYVFLHRKEESYYWSASLKCPETYFRVPMPVPHSNDDTQR